LNVLVVAAHPDDEVLGCGATIAQLARAGSAIHICVLGEGVTSRASQREAANPQDVDELRGQAEAVGRLLGAREVSLHALPDNRFDTVPLLDIVKTIEVHVDLLRPEIVYTHHSGDLNVDHRITHEAVLAATRPTPGQSVTDVYAWETPSATEWRFGSTRFAPNVFVDVSRTLDDKIAAMHVYEGEVRGFPHPRSTQALRAAAHRWGSTVGLHAAEAFELVRSVRAIPQPDPESNDTE
jgi:LmbE family N-acetylglucosaminyl deacetylase